MTDKMLKSFVYRDDEVGICISIDSRMSNEGVVLRLKPSYYILSIMHLC